MITSWEQRESMVVDVESNEKEHVTVRFILYSLEIGKLHHRSTEYNTITKAGSKTPLDYAEQLISITQDVALRKEKFENRGFYLVSVEIQKYGDLGSEESSGSRAYLMDRQLMILVSVILAASFVISVVISVAVVFLLLRWRKRRNERLRQRGLSWVLGEDDDDKLFKL